MDTPKLIISKADLESMRPVIETEFYDYEPNKLVHDDKYEALKSLNDMLTYYTCKYGDEEFIIFEPEFTSESEDIQDKLDELDIYFVAYHN